MLTYPFVAILIVPSKMHEITGGAAKSIHPTTRKEKYIIEKTAGF